MSSSVCIKSPNSPTADFSGMHGMFNGPWWDCSAFPTYYSPQSLATLKPIMDSGAKKGAIVGRESCNGQRSLFGDKEDRIS